jgi:hypothetical protein
MIWLSSTLVTNLLNTNTQKKQKNNNFNLKYKKLYYQLITGKINRQLIINRLFDDLPLFITEGYYLVFFIYLYGSKKN